MEYEEITETVEEVTKTLKDIKLGSLDLHTLISAALLFLVCFLTVKILMAAVKRILGRSKLDAAAKGYIIKAVNFSLWVLVIIMVASTLGVDTASLVAVVSLAGLALSLSLQSILGNIFSGITILGSRPFAAGDYVELAGVVGTVRNVGLFYTTLTMIDNKTVHIPNSQVTDSLITNYTEQGTRRLDLSFGIEYEAGPEEVKAALLEAANSDERVLSEPVPPFAGIQEYKDSTVEYILQVWVSSADYLAVKFYLNEAVAESLAKRGVSMSYPHMRVHIEE